MNTGYLILGMAVMSLTTYLIRMIPMAVFRKRINSRFVQSFLYYVPYAVLAAMTFPSVFSSTGSVISSVVGCVAAVILAYCGKGLLTVSIGAVATAFVMLLLGL